MLRIIQLVPADSVHPETRIHSTSPPGSFNPGHADSLNRNPRHDSFKPHRLLCSTHHADSLHAKTHSTTETRSLVPRPPRTSMPRPPALGFESEAASPLLTLHHKPLYRCTLHPKPSLAAHRGSKYWKRNSGLYGVQYRGSLNYWNHVSGYTSTCVYICMHIHLNAYIYIYMSIYVCRCTCL